MTIAKILDTGLATATSTSGVLSTSERAGVTSTGNGLNHFEFLIVNQTINGGGTLQNDPEIKNDDSLSTISPVTYSNPVLVLTCKIPYENIGSNWQYDWLYQLIRLERTKGKKVLYLQSNNTSGDFSGDRVKTLVERYGQRYKGEALKTIVASPANATEGTVPYIPGYVKNVSNISFSANEHAYKFQITFMVDDN